MTYRFSRLPIPPITLGTMTFGEQNTEAEAHAQLDMALDYGIYSIDTAEMYPVPPSAETYGSTEAYIGSWLKSRGGRDKVWLASKAAGPARGSDQQNYIRGGARFTYQQIIQACEDSLRRLQTDYLDLYQLHWPERTVNYFGKLGLSALNDAPDVTPIEETQSALEALWRAGKIRAYGLSNETPWGLMSHLQRDCPVPLLSVQNPYSLLNRSYEVGLAECSLREDVGLLAYSPLGFGVLTGKYRQDKALWNPDWRLAKFERFTRYIKPAAIPALERYAALAQSLGMSLTHMALAFVRQQEFVATTIIGATNLEQLRDNLDSLQVTLSPEALAAIDEIHAIHSNPCP
ncbi:MAG: aldo/keto reductase [Cardiobacteriaceae bacterium]|nr:aldo/keto reductase [Cardiobacteriaceae bacterium]